MLKTTHDTHNGSREQSRLRDCLEKQLRLEDEKKKVQKEIPKPVKCDVKERKVTMFIHGCWPIRVRVLQICEISILFYKAQIRRAVTL